MLTYIECRINIHFLKSVFSFLYKWNKYAKPTKKIIIKVLKRYISGIILLMSIMGVKAQTSDSLIVDIMRKEGVSFSHDNSVTLLTSGREKFQDMFAAIRQARKSIHLEYFNFRNDSIANALFDLLVLSQANLGYS